MMSNERKTARIDRLAKAIGYIANDFEKFGAAFLDALLLVPMSHKGTNLLGYPVAGVVDTVSDDGRIAAAYSDEKGYFGGTMAKAEKDLLQAIAARPKATDIFLLSGMSKRPQIADDFETRVAKLPEMNGRALHLWGSEEIAERIVDELLVSDTVVGRLAYYLPELARIRDEEAASNLAPAVDRTHIVRDDIDRHIFDHRATGQPLIIGGIGGLGKSAAAAAYAAKHAGEYDLVIWLEGAEVPTVQRLHSMPLDRGGEQRNIAALLRTRACLLIIDDAEPTLRFDALVTLCGTKSHIVLTQRALSPGSYELPLMERAQAETLLITPLLAARPTSSRPFGRPSTAIP